MKKVNFIVFLSAVLCLAGGSVLADTPNNSAASAVYLSSTMSTTSGSGSSEFSHLLSDLSFSKSQLRTIKQSTRTILNGKLPSGYSSWNAYADSVIDNLDLTQEQKDTINQTEVPEGYDSWKDYMSNNPKTVITALSKLGGASSLYNQTRNALMTMPIALQTGGYLNQLNSYDQALQNADTYMMLPYKVRLAYKYANRYAVVDSNQQGGLPNKQNANTTYSAMHRVTDDGGIWARPYFSTGSIGFKNGPKVDNMMYGIYIGGDSAIKPLKHGDFQYSAYIGYNGSHQSYSGNSIYSNGGTGGITGTWFGDKAFTSLTINAGASNSELSTFYTTKEYPMFSAGIASKTGYNFEFAEGKFIIQPSYLMSYSFITPFQSGSIAGVDIDSKPLHAINISPGVKFIGNLKHGWQPYAEARMVWNILDKTSYATNYIDIPSLSIKPYAQYGVGVQKLWGERAIGFLQFLMRSGGRNDVAFSTGLKFFIGKKSNL